MSARFGRNKRRAFQAEIAKRDAAFAELNRKHDELHRWRAQESLRASQLQIVLDGYLKHGIETFGKVVHDGIQLEIKIDSLRQEKRPVYSAIALDSTELYRLANKSYDERNAHIRVLSSRIAHDLMGYLARNWKF